MTTTIDVLGGPEALDVRNPLELERLLREGLPVTAVLTLARRMKVPRSVMYHIVSRRTLERYSTARRGKGRAASSQRLTPETSARVARYARLWALAEETFGDADMARAWLFEPVPALGGDTPFAMAATESGALLVEQELVRLAYGVYS